MVATEAQLTKWYGRPKSFKPVAVQNRLPWLPRSSKGNVQVVLVHPLIADEFVAACHAAAQACPGWVPQRIDSYVPRPIRGAWGYNKDGSEKPPPKGWQLGDKKTSRHSWAVAFDFFATPSDQYPPGGVWTPDNGMPEAFGRAFEARGWTWGHRWNRTDTPHLEYSADPSKLLNLGPVGADYVDWLSGMVKLGDVGIDVRDLKLGLAMLDLKVDLSPGQEQIFGPDTDAAVRQVQAAMGLIVDGMVGPQTERALLAAWHQSMPNPEAMVARGYRVILGADRTPSPEAVAYWVDQIRSKGLSAFFFAIELWNSPEAKARRGVPTTAPAPQAAPAPAPQQPAPPPTPPPAPPAPGAPPSVGERLAAIANQLAALAGEL